MKIFKRKNDILLEIKQELFDLNKKINQEYNRRSKWEDNKEKYLFDALDAKGKLETERAKLLKEQTNFKDTIVVKDSLIEDLENKNKSQKKTIQDLTSEINILVKYKNERETLIKEKEKLEKELLKANQYLAIYEEKYGKLPKKVPGSTMPRKKPAIGIKESKVSGSTKSELKKINELREKEEV